MYHHRQNGMVACTKIGGRSYLLFTGSSETQTQVCEINPNPSGFIPACRQRNNWTEILLFFLTIVEDSSEIEIMPEGLQEQIGLITESVSLVVFFVLIS